MECSEFPVPSDKPRITLYIDQGLKEALEILAELADRSVSNYVVQLIKQDVARAQQSGELSGFLASFDLSKPKDIALLKQSREDRKKNLRKQDEDEDLARFEKNEAEIEEHLREVWAMGIDEVSARILSSDDEKDMKGGDRDDQHPVDPNQMDG